MKVSAIPRREAGETPPEFVELEVDVSGSPLWNPDLAPTTLQERTWSTWNIAALWIGMSVVITSYTMAGGLVESGMSWWQALLTVLLGNLIVLVPMVLNAHAGTKYGVSFPVLCRASFGTRGANLAALARAVVACGWFGIQTWIGGAALDSLFIALSPAWAGLLGGLKLAGVSAHAWAAFLLFWGLEVVIILRGVDGVKHLQTWSAPVLLLGSLALLIWAAGAAGGLERVLWASDALQKQRGEFWALFPAGLTAAVGYWATLSLNIADFTRYARSQRSQVLGQALGLPTTMTAFSFVGVAVTSATVLIYGQAVPDPVEVVRRFQNPLVVIIGALVICMAQLTTNLAANVVAPANDFSNLAPRRISFVAGGLITAAIGVLMMPWRLLDSMGAYIFTWLVGYSGLMGAIGGIMVCDYWILRRTRLELPELFNPNGRYSYSGGWNRRALVAMAAAILPVVPGFLRAASTPGGRVAQPGALDTLYDNAWFFTFAVAALVYYALMRERQPGAGRRTSVA